MNNSISKVVAGKSTNMRQSYFEASPSSSDMQYIDGVLSDIRSASAEEQDSLIRRYWPRFGLTGSYDEKLSQARFLISVCL